MGGEEAVERLEELADNVWERRGEGEEGWFGSLGSLERVMGKLACLRASVSCLHLHGERRVEVFDGGPGPEVGAVGQLFLGALFVKILCVL